MRTALAASLNVPAVRTLELIGADDFATRLRALGFAGIDRRGDHYGPALALGAAEVSLAELVNAYRTLANGRRAAPAPPRCRAACGGRRRTSGIRRTRRLHRRRHPLRSREPEHHVRPREPLATRFWSAVKTGTSKDMRDNWCVGFSSRYTVGVWVGTSRASRCTT
jgi:penicillin-binding protein 1C